MLLKDKVAIVTGGASAEGIGRATARLFARQGARVAILDLAQEQPEAAAAELGREHRGYVCDVADHAACIETVEEIAGRFGAIDVLIGNAGVVYGTPILEIEPDEYDEVLDVNLRGNFQMAQAVVPHLQERGGGAIVPLGRRPGRTGRQRSGARRR